MGAKTILNIQPKAFTNRGVRHTPENTDGVYNATITEGKSGTMIRIFGTRTNHVNGPKAFNLVFGVGEAAEYDSFNLHYVGVITAIGPGSVTIQHDPSDREKSRLDLYNFIRRNWNFDAKRIADYNAEERICL